MSIVRELNFINYAAERGVALIQSFNSNITTDEEQKQFLSDSDTETGGIRDLLGSEEVMEC